MNPAISVVIPAHNPRLDYLQAVLGALRTQTLPASEWELLVVDNRSEPPLSGRMDLKWHPNTAVVREEALGLTRARVAGFQHARGDFIVLVDDDNMLASDYLANVVRLFTAHPRIGALGGKSLAEFESEPPEWAGEFLALLALRDLGDSPHISNGLRPNGASRNQYPADAAPIGAGMAIRREAARQWLANSSTTQLSDRRGDELTSGGDNDIVFTLMKHGWQVGYFPELSLTHLISTGRLDADYLARLNRGIHKSWMQVLTKHDANPWPPIPAWTVPLRKLKAWFLYLAWSGPAARIRWHGACGHFEGRVAI